MLALELRFVQERAEDGNLVYRLDPYVICLRARQVSQALRPIDVFITYEGKRSADVAASRYAVRHLVTAEVGRHPCHDYTEALQIDEKRLKRQAEQTERRVFPKHALHSAK